MGGEELLLVGGVAKPACLGRKKCEFSRNCVTVWVCEDVRGGGRKGEREDAACWRIAFIKDGS